MNRRLQHLGCIGLAYTLSPWLAAQAQTTVPEQETAKPQPAAPVTGSLPDVLVFTNGDRLTGKLERAAGGDVVFRSDMAGELTIPLGKVKELRSGSQFVALRKGDTKRNAPVGAGTVTFTGDQVEIEPNNRAPEHLPAAQLGYLIDMPTYARAVDHHAGLLEDWSGAATAGFTLVRSTEKSTTFTGALNFVRTVPDVSYLPLRNRTRVNVTETYGTEATPVIPQTAPPSQPSVVQTSIFHADSERDGYFSSRLFFLGDLSFDHNFSQGLQLQQVFGIGFGWTPYKGERQELDLRVDTHYEKQQFLPTVLGTANSANGAAQDNLNLVGSTFQENYRRTLPRKFMLTEWANILPAWNDRRAYTANAYLALTMPLFKRLGATVSATDNYLNNPSPGYRTNSVQLVTGLTYTIK